MKRIITIAALLLILTLTFTACFGGGKDKNEETVYDILTDVFAQTVANRKSESASVWEEALSGGSIEINGTYGEDIIPIKTISGKTYYSKDSYATNLSLSLITGETFDLSAFSTKEKIVFLSSAFAGAYGFTAEGYSEFITQMLMGDGNAASTAASTAFSEALTTFFEKNGDTVAKALETRFPLIMNQAESSLHFSFVISNTNLKAFLGDMIALLENDAAFKQAFQDYLIANGASLTSGQLDEEFNEMKADLNELDEMPFNAAVSITANTDRIITGASITVYEGVPESGSILNNQKQLARILISLPTAGGFTVEATIEDQTITAGYTVTEYGTLTKEVLSIGMPGITLTPLTLTYDSSNGDYEVKVEIPGTFSATAKGNYTATKDEATFTLSSIKMTIPTDYSDTESILGGAGSTVIDLPMTVTVKVKAKDTAPKAPASYTDINTLSEDELAALGEKLMNDPVVAAFMEMCEDLFGSNLEDMPTITE